MRDISVQLCNQGIHKGLEATGLITGEFISIWIIFSNFGKEE
jgi:hypothetical protein